jgi:uncharacterized protein (TIGR02300 family)
VAKAELGTKRLCASCGAKFYDLSKDPITCPKCSAVFQVVVPTSRGRPDAAAAAAARTEAAAKETEAPETADAEFVSLEEADAEAQGKKKKANADPTADSDDDIEIEDDDDDAAFIPEEEEDTEDVTDIIGDVDKEEET